MIGFKRLLCGLVCWLSLMSTMVLAKEPKRSALGGEICEVTVNLKGMVCPFCTYSLEKAFEKQNYVEKVETIDLQNGTATLRLVPGTSRSLKSLESDLANVIKKATFDSGGIAGVVVAGVLREDEAGIVMRIGGSDDASKLFVLETHSASHKVPAKMPKKIKNRIKKECDKASVVTITTAVHSHVDGSFCASNLEKMTIK